MFQQLLRHQERANRVHLEDFHHLVLIDEVPRPFFIPGFGTDNPGVVYHHVQFDLLQG